MRMAYDDEDNAPMSESSMPGVEMNWKRYSDMIANMQQEQPLPFTDPPLPEKGCWNCQEYNGYACMIRWNNANEDYYNPDLDDRQPTDSCENWELNPDISPDEFN